MGNGAPYNMGKAALEALAFTLAKEERQHNIHVNVVAPGIVETDMGVRLSKAMRGVKELDMRSARRHLALRSRVPAARRGPRGAVVVQRGRRLRDGAAHRVRRWWRARRLLSRARGGAPDEGVEALGVAADAGEEAREHEPVERRHGDPVGASQQARAGGTVPSA